MLEKNYRKVSGIKDYERIYKLKYIEHGGSCQICGRSMHEGTPQLAHIIAKSKTNVSAYGMDFIDSYKNLKIVCSLTCNLKTLSSENARNQG